MLALSNTTLPASILSTDKVERLKALLDKSNAENTKATYRKQFGYFLAWCSKNGVAFDEATVISPELLALHIEDLHHQGYRLDTIKARLRAVAKFHREQQAARERDGLPAVESPTGHHYVTGLFKGMKGDIAEREQVASDFSQSKRKASCMWVEDVHALCQAVDTSTLAGVRDLAIILVGWAGAFRRSELVSLKVADLQPTEWGYLVSARNTKTNKTVTKQLRREPASAPWCPVRALEAWLAASGIKDGFVFRSFNMAGMQRNKPLVLTDKGLPDKCVEMLVKKLAKRAGLREGKWSAHSLRRGYVSQHLAWGVAEQAVRRQAGFTATSPVFFEYVEEARDHTEHRSMLSKPTP